MNHIKKLSPYVFLILLLPQAFAETTTIKALGSFEKIDQLIDHTIQLEKKIQMVNDQLLREAQKQVNPLIQQLHVRIQTQPENPKYWLLQGVLYRTLAFIERFTDKNLKRKNDKEYAREKHYRKHLDKVNVSLIKALELDLSAPKDQQLNPDQVNKAIKNFLHPIKIESDLYEAINRHKMHQPQYDSPKAQQTLYKKIYLNHMREHRLTAATRIINELEKHFPELTDYIALARQQIQAHYAARIDGYHNIDELIYAFDPLHSPYLGRKRTNRKTDLNNLIDELTRRIQNNPENPKYWLARGLTHRAMLSVDKAFYWPDFPSQKSYFAYPPLIELRAKIKADYLKAFELEKTAPAHQQFTIKILSTIMNDVLIEPEILSLAAQHPARQHMEPRYRKNGYIASYESHLENKNYQKALETLDNMAQEFPEQFDEFVELRAQFKDFVSVEQMTQPPKRPVLQKAPSQAPPQPKISDQPKKSPQLATPEQEKPSAKTPLIAAILLFSGLIGCAYWLRKR